ncbi:PepSY domain-containing protein [Ruegeria pomeroyi]|uniref:PepSY domain-containing protein n=1 Tax=Ruegeria alba TaxID=2916756 RepID=A0ABS9NYZ2_9RHOB|nr:PepSY domain-containing protein [Ruegeria alba]MCE8513769.1 PepSY domain-containing protein [Ruegeria pomeroyi]MCE8530633.1 PepSY domain-containing protein [Ruegeria pomeroyi]MCE8544589.1 PepSY domain-containing protein [Ruegeria pomeroyi]MCE8553060.1 PepSY domain-containing protein [Ruegeria pomeroyi]MCG6559454.1 PepSY domain-containing protein [Ruegeria alba]
MKSFALIAALALAASPVLALDLTTDTQLGTSSDEIRTSLKDLGYDVRKIEDEDGKIEAYVVKDGKMAEVYVDPTTGKISKIEME